MRDSRAPAKQAKAVEDGVKHAIKSMHTFKFKEIGVVPDATRGLVRDLVKKGIPTTHVREAIETVAEHFAVSIEGSISDRTISRIILEGGVAAKLQLTEEIRQSKGSLTLHQDTI